MRWSITLQALDLEVVARFCSMINPAESGPHPGAQLSHHERGWAWMVRAPWLDVVINNEVCGDWTVWPAAWVPSRAIWLAHAIATRDGDCTLTFENDMVAVRGETITAVFDVPDRPIIEPRLMMLPGRATAVVDHSWLTLMSKAVSTIPAGVPMAIDPDVVLSIAEGGLTTTVNWAPAGCGRHTVHVAGDVTGSGMVRISHHRLRQVLDATEGLDEFLVVHIPVHPSEALRLQGTWWNAYIDPVGTMPEPWTPCLDEALVGYDVDWFDDTSMSITFGPHTVDRCSIHKGDNGSGDVLQLAMSLAEVPICTLALLTELNDLNRGLTGVRLWWEAGSVVAGCELPFAQLIDLPRTIAALCEQTESLEPILGALAAE